MTCSSWPVCQLRRLGSHDGVTVNERRLSTVTIDVPVSLACSSRPSVTAPSRVRTAAGCPETRLCQESRVRAPHAAIAAGKHATESPKGPTAAMTTPIRGRNYGPEPPRNSAAWGERGPRRASPRPTGRACGRCGHQKADAHTFHRPDGECKRVSRKKEWVTLSEQKRSTSRERRSPPKGSRRGLDSS